MCGNSTKAYLSLNIKTTEILLTTTCLCQLSLCVKTMYDHKIIVLRPFHLLQHFSKETKILFCWLGELYYRLCKYLLEKIYSKRRCSRIIFACLDKMLILGLLCIWVSALFWLMSYLRCKLFVSGKLKQGQYQ